MGIEDLKRARDLVSSGGWGVIPAYFICIFFVYVAIWIAIEPASIPESFGISGKANPSRFRIHLASSVFFGSLLFSCIIIFAIRMKNRTIELINKENEVLIEKNAVLSKKILSTKIPDRPTGDFFDPEVSVQFYDRIAGKYDDRNSASLHVAHQRVCDEIVDYLNKRKKLKLPANARPDVDLSFYAQNVAIKVLDLGGGTGKLIAERFLRMSSFEWHYVDESSEMLKIFKENMRPPHGKSSSEIIKTFEYLETIEEFLQHRSSSKDFEGRFDLVILSFALTSMHHNPDWGAVTKLISAGGRLIVADIDASYTNRYPHYSVETEHGHCHLKPRAVPMTVIQSEIGRRLIQRIPIPIRKNKDHYAYVTTFDKKLVT